MTNEHDHPEESYQRITFVCTFVKTKFWRDSSEVFGNILAKKKSDILWNCQKHTHAQRGQEL
jgi:hypothetical protein